MVSLVRYTFADSISTLVMDDGKVNVMSLKMLGALNDALDRAENDNGVVLLTGRQRVFSAGFDLADMSSNPATSSPETLHNTLKAGAELAERIMSFPLPVVTACNGHAYPMGAFLMLSADYRIGAKGDFKIGMNEVAIGLTVPLFAIEIARGRLQPAYFSRTVISGEMFSPETAVAAGFLDETAEADALMDTAREKAAALSKLHMPHHHATKLRARANTLKALRAAIDRELTLENATAKLAAR